MRIRNLLGAVGIASVGLLPACAASDTDATAASRMAATSAVAAAETPTAAAAASPTAAAAATATSTDLPIGVGGRASGAEGWPAESPQQPGERVFAVYLAVGPEGDPALAEASGYLDSLGYSTSGARRLACDEGAAEALRRDPEERGVAVYLEWRYVADFTALHKDSGRGFVDMVPVTRTC